jgi:hypothetical protein
VQVRAALSGHHLATSLPLLPPKHSKLLHNHACPRFQELRRQELEQWLAKLVNVPRVLRVPAALPFLGVAQVFNFVRGAGLGHHGGQFFSTHFFFFGLAHSFRCVHCPLTSFFTSHPQLLPYPTTTAPVGWGS